MSEFHHVSVMLRECIDGLNIRPEGIYVDGTLGGAGHSYQIASRLTSGKLIGIDRDNVALEAANGYADEILVTLHQDGSASVFDNGRGMPVDTHPTLGISGVDGILLDLGVSSPQLDDGERGFSYMSDAPLDMRMDNTENMTAADVVNTWSQEELRRILYAYGEER